MNTNEQDTAARATFNDAWRAPRMIPDRYPHAVTQAYWQMCAAFWQERIESEETQQ